MPVTRARIAVVDSNRLFRASLISLLDRGRVHPVREAASIEELAKLTTDGGSFDIILLEARTPEPDAPCPAAGARALMPGARITMLAETFDAAQLRKCLAAGADGYLLKDISSEALQASLNLLLLGEKILPSSLADMLSQEGVLPVNGCNPATMPDGSARGLSEREMEILRCLVNGDSNKCIANRLRIAEATVKVHLKSILRKTHAANRTQAAIWALQRGVSGIAASALIALGATQLQALIEDAQTLTMI